MTTTKSPTKREKATAQRRRTILEAAVTCFIESGYHQTGVRDIAKRSGVSLGNLYNHFASKIDVLAEIAAIERAELQPHLALLSKAAPAPEVLDEFLSAYTRHLSSPEMVILGLEITSEAIRQTEIADLFSESRTAVTTALKDLLSRGAEEGSMRPMQNTLETANLILEVMEGSAFRHGIEGVSIKKILRNQSDFVRAAVLAP